MVTIGNNFGHAPTAHGRDTESKPLQGLRVIDFSALGPGPFGSRILADYGADVVIVEPPWTDMHDSQRMFGRSKRSVVIDLQNPLGRDLALELTAHFDCLVESMRPGKMEALGLGPNEVRAKNPRLIYTRLTAFGQYGPLSSLAGHDINAIAIGGALGLVGLNQPLPPASLVGDFGGGSLMIVIGVLLGMLKLQRSGEGSVVDAAMSDGAALLAGGLFPSFNRGEWGPRGTNLVDGSRPFYRTYQCSDGKWIAVGAVEPKFFKAFIEAIGLADVIDISAQYDPTIAVVLGERIQEKIAQRPRDFWADLFAKVDACVSPVLELGELATHPHHRARGSVYGNEAAIHSGLAPRFVGPAPVLDGVSPKKGQHTFEVLRDAGIQEETIKRAVGAQAIQGEPP